jgi:hypothetical protein
VTAVGREGSVAGELTSREGYLDGRQARLATSLPDAGPGCRSLGPYRRPSRPSFGTPALLS